MTGGNNQLSARFCNLSGLDPTIEDPFVAVGHRPGTATSATAIGAISVRVEFAQIVTTGSCYRPTFFKIRLTEGFQGFAAIVAWIVIRDSHLMDRLIQLDFSLFNIFEQQIKDGDDLELFECFGIPFVQPGPGCKVGVASLGKE